MSEKTTCHAHLLGPQQINAIFDKLSERIIPKCELNYSSAFELLIAVVLSAQTTDESVNRVTPALWEKCHTPQDYIDLGEDGISDCIRSIGLYRNKAKSLVGLCKMLIDKYDGCVPSSREELMSLPGVGRKTANVVLNVWFKQPTMAVDTHVFRVANRLGIVSADTPEAVELALMERVPKKYLLNAHHYLLLHGRYTCTAKKPQCETCSVAKWCSSANQFSS
ncbi:MAG: endonuclease III [Victivallales bacterium]|nr:endonuclease III [Victivallales bacterium]